MEYIDQLKIKGILYTLKDPTVAAQINARIEELIGTAPSNLDTLQELAAAILNGDEALESVLTSLASKTSKEYVDNLFNTIQLTPGPLGEQGIQGPKGQDGKSAYQSYLDTTSDDPALSESDWIASLHGSNGQDGQNGLDGTNGTDGITPHIDLTTGNWFIGETNTGVHAQGETGTFDPSDLDDYATKQEVNNKIGSLGNKVEAQAAVYYTEAECNTANAELEGALEAESPLTQEQAGAYNLAVDGATKLEGDELSETEANMYNATLEGAISTSDIKTPAVPAVPYTNVGEVLSNIKTQLGGISIVKITQAEYNVLQNKDENTLYVVIDE